MQEILEIQVLCSIYSMHLEPDFIGWYYVQWCNLMWFNICGGGELKLVLFVDIQQNYFSYSELEPEQIASQFHINFSCFLMARNDVLEQDFLKKNKYYSKFS